MAKNKVEIDVKVDDKGTTKKLGLESKKAAKGLEDTAKSARTADRNLKGAAQASSNTTKNFSKMAQGTGGLVAAYATLAANIFAISAAFQFLKRAGDLRALENAQTQYTSKTGLGMKLLTSRIQEATGGIVSFQEASQAAAIGIAAGLSPDQLERLGSAAKNAAAALGRDTTDAFQRLTRGAIKAEPELLDELGIIVRLEKATNDYARSMNILDRDLTTFEKTQAVVNATLTQAEEKFDDIGDSVNDVARLGKAFDDLVKGIQRKIVGPAEFIADVFTKNVFALSAAFALLGVNITRALAPAVDMENLDDLAKEARKRVSAAALPGSAAGAKAAKGDFSSMKTLEKAAGSDKSTVLNVQNMSKANREQIKKDLKIIQAEHARTMATNSRGFKKYALTVKANLKMMQAQHGAVMGTMKAGIGGLAKFASKAMSAIAIIGIITLAVSLGKELLNLLKSKELKQMEEQAERMKNRFSEQNEAITETLQTLDRAETTMGRIVQHSNIFSQLSTKGSTRLLDGFQKLDASTMFTTQTIKGQERQVQTTTSGQRESARNAASANFGEGGAIASFITTLELAGDVARKAGKDTSGYSSKIQELKTTLNLVENANLTTREGVEAYNKNVLRSKNLVAELVEQKTALGTSLQAETNAIKGVSKAYETYLGLQAQVGGNKTFASQVASNLKEFGSSIAGFTTIGKNQTLGGKITAADAKKMAQVLGIDVQALNSMTRGQAETAFNTAGNEILAGQKNLTMSPFDNQRKLNAAQQTGFEFRKREAQKLKEIADLNLKLAAFEQEKLEAKRLNKSLDQNRLNQIAAETAFINQQKQTIEYNFSEIGELSNTLQSSLEQGLGTALDGLIQGSMNVKEAFASMARSVLQAISQILAKQAATSILGSLGLPTGRYGGIMSDGKKIQGYSAGGIARGRDAGYLAELHGTEAVVPLPNGRSIPVQLKGSGQTNHVTVNIAQDGSTQTKASSGVDQENLGKAVAAAVQKELQNQKRSGGILSPYGAA